MDKSLLTKGLFWTSFALMLIGGGILLWDTLSDTPTSSVQQSATRTSAGPIPAKADIPSPEHIKPVPQSLESKTVLLQKGDSLSRTLNRLGVSNRQIAQLLQVDENGVLSQLQPGQKLTTEILVPSNNLKSLTLSVNRERAHTFKQIDDGYLYQEQITPIETVLAYKEVTIHNSLFVDGSNAGISDKQLLEITNIFRWDIDFALDIRQGDRFALLYEERFIEGDKIGTGNIIAAQFINNGRIFEAIRYQLEQQTDYFTRDGLSLRKAFIRTPVDFTRVSSQFNPHRLHPIFKTSRPHQGVDYAAPTGTPVQSSGDGNVAFVGTMKGYGNTVIIDHGAGYTTLYAHLSGFADNMIAGREVYQGDTIAYVGQTGWATGPHLHYEFRINGTHKNPETVDIPYDSPMTKSELMAFLPYAQTLMGRLESSHTQNFANYLAKLTRNTP